MRKFIILLLITILFIPAIPSLAAENGNIYEVTIYPNGRGMFRGNSDDLVIGDVGVTYNVDNEKNEIDIYFDEAIFVCDVISEGNTIHKSIKFDSEDQVREVNEELMTRGFKSANVKSIKLEYDDVSSVDTITLQSANIDFSGGLLDGKKLELFSPGSNPGSTRLITDNDLSTYYKLNKDGPRITARYSFENPVDITGYRLYCSYIKSGMRLIFQYLDGEKEETVAFDIFNITDTKVSGEFIELNLEKVTRVSLAASNKVSSESYVLVNEFNLYGIQEEPPQEEVSGLDYTLKGNNVTLTWTNPSNDKFEGVMIYRDGEYIETTTEESFTESLSIGTYQYRITTLEDGEESEGIIIDVSVQTIPTPVKGVNMINTSSSGGTITWDPNPKAQSISKYIVYVNGEKHGEIENPPYQLEDLESGKKYNIAVSAVNSMGEGDRSDPVSYTPSKIEDLKDTIKIGEILSYISMLFTSVWPLLALTMSIILSPYITSAIKSVARSRRNA